MNGQTDVRMFTSVHTDLGNNKRISTIYRKYENENFTSWRWETIAWDGDKIIDMDETGNINQVLEKHIEFFEKYS
ncbi:hypothetical protein [Virgibacillus salexigens]|uniref:Uncharacterized protein n=1 Tax=Virgibacillus kapii TaxID=1638645 RepID=A0ABQ2D7Z8_9BACI|nr:hypothetical protein [Virgibacillus kapii]GGJ48885.1 hypothetical protein GCM10007111_08650 [Virgibacillus kapii]